MTNISKLVLLTLVLPLMSACGEAPETQETVQAPAVQDPSAPIQNTEEAGMGLKIFAVRADTGELAGETKWRLTAPDEIYTFEGDDAVWDLNKMLETELGPGEYVVEAFSGDFAGSAYFTLPNKKEAVYIKLVSDVAALPPSLEVMGDITVNNEFQVMWTAPDGTPADFVVITDKGAELNVEYWDDAKAVSGQALLLKAPAAPGVYDILYVQNGADANTIGARISVNVVGADYALSPIGEIFAGRQFKVSWEAQNDEGDIIAIGPRTSATDDAISMERVSTGNPLTLTAPAKPGDYELRYYTGGYVLLFVTPITVK